MSARSLSLSTFAVLMATAFGASSGDTTPGFRSLEVGGKQPAWYHPPVPPAAQRPLTVFLHGMCALPEWECPVFEGATGSSWLLCPPGPTACAGGGAMWVGPTEKLGARVGKSIELLERREPGTMDLGRRTLVGYSLGAPAALRLALSEPGRWRRLMIVNASTDPSLAHLKKAGVERLALVAGELDGTSQKLRRTAKRLAGAGFDARYFSMGKVGHYFDAKSAERLQEALTWIGADWPSAG